MLFINFYSFHLPLIAKQSVYKNAYICLKWNLRGSIPMKDIAKKIGKRKLNIAEVNSITRHLVEENKRKTTLEYLLNLLGDELYNI